MRQEQGLAELTNQHKSKISVKTLSELLLEDLKDCRCNIFGKTAEEVPVLLAELTLIPDSLYYEMFDHRIDFTVAGFIENNQYVPLTYRVDGNKYNFYGRCSTVPKVCGVDLYLNKSYTEKLGDDVRQNFSISIKKLLNSLS